MRKVHDVLRLHFGLKMPQRQIARSIQVSQSTVSEYLTRFEQSGLSWPLPEGFDDHRLQQKLFGPGSGKPEGTVARPLPDFEQIRHELATNCQCRNKTPAILPVLPIINLGGDAVSTLQ